jgi:hypothetical protein
MNVAKEVAPIEGSKRRFSRSYCSRGDMAAYGFGEQLCCVSGTDYIEQSTHSIGRCGRSVARHIDACALSLESSVTTGLRDNRIVPPRTGPPNMSLSLGMGQRTVPQVLESSRCDLQYEAHRHLFELDVHPHQLCPAG